MFFVLFCLLGFALFFVCGRRQDIILSLGTTSGNAFFALCLDSGINGGSSNSEQHVWWSEPSPFLFFHSPPVYTTMISMLSPLFLALR